MVRISILSSSTFSLDIIGPVTNIRSVIDNCTNISVYWDSPTLHDNRVSVLYYNLSIYDDISSQLIKSVSVYDTSYQFEDKDLFIHRYTYVITAVNELGKGIRNNKTFSYQRSIIYIIMCRLLIIIVPKSAQDNTSLDLLSYTEYAVNIQFHIPVCIMYII